MSPGSASSASWCGGVAALGGQPDRRQRALADDHRVDELDGDVARVRARGGRARRRASSRPPRAKRSAIAWHSRAMRSASAPKNAALARVRSSQQRARRARPPGRCAELTPARPPARPAPTSQSRQAVARPRPSARSTSIVATPGCTASRLASSRSTSKSRCGQQVDLVDEHELAGAEHQRVLQRLVLALGDRADHHARVLADAELGRADEVADVLDDEQVEVVERRSPASAERTMFASRWHSPPKPASVLSCVDGHVQRTRAGRRRSEPCDVALQHAGAHAAEVGAARARAAPSCPRPGALMRLTTRTPARSKSSRLARAIVLLASSASSTTLTLMRCMRYIDRIFM